MRFRYPQKPLSFQNSLGDPVPGKLLVIATPIGNLKDISPRVEASLKVCDFILAEDTRVSIKILNHLKIKKRMLSCHEFNEGARLDLISKVRDLNQTVALLSDAGTPLVSDPGYEIVRKAIESEVEVIVIPGPSAFLLALVGSGLPCNRFSFEGFLPDKTGAAKQRLLELRQDLRTLVFYVAPHKIEKTLALVKSVLGDRQVCVARELTKIHEQFLRGTISELETIAAKGSIIGECVLVVSGATDDDLAASDKPSEEVLVAAINDLHSQGLGLKEISTRLSGQFGLKRAKVYELALTCLKKRGE